MEWIRSCGIGTGKQVWLSCGLHRWQHNIGRGIRSQYVQHIGEYVDDNVWYYRWFWLRFNLFTGCCSRRLLFRNKTFIGHRNCCMRFRCVTNSQRAFPLVFSAIQLKMNIFNLILFGFIRFWNVCICTVGNMVGRRVWLEKCQFNFGRFDFKLCDFRCSHATANVSVFKKDILIFISVAEIPMLKRDFSSTDIRSQAK